MSGNRLQVLLGGLPQLVMYDLDGTLVDSVPGIALAVDRLLTELGVAPAGEARVRTWVGGGQRLLVEQALDYANLGQALFDRALAGFRRHYADTAECDLRLFDGVRALLDFMAERGVAQAVVTNKPIEFVPAMLQSLGVDHYFSRLLGGECLAQRKPHPLPLTTLLAEYGVAPEQALMVGDSSNDLLAAKGAGVPCLAVSYGYARGEDLSQFGPLWLGDNLAELLAPA
ncbi:phosphoglycolate phosphatase [Halioxenophilus sp. WMMB6]|uniref:phosphoglycolate phosphatase n=1 Tax=Halioxenophilus sp. WMMB6 TaxID=3073815 RepID=UPI00295F4EA5|nr:phosphoglycolate phosphatase [Halioxenophilus sp. WMMB6]